MAGREQVGYWQNLRRSHLNRRRLLSSGATFVTGGIALGLIGCDGSRQNPATARSGTTMAGSAGAAVASPHAVATSSAVSTFKAGGVIQGVAPGVAINLDPVGGGFSSFFSGFHYSRLFRPNSGPDPSVSLSREPVPDLVSGYEITPDGLTYTMRLRQDVTFHPPLSRSLTSADVKASWEYITTSPRALNKVVYAPVVDSLTTPDTTTLVWRLKQPNAWFLNKLGDPFAPCVISQEAATGTIDPERVVAGTGPWIFDGLTSTALTWKRNPDYFIKGLPYAAGAQLNIIAEFATQGAQFTAGKLDVLNLALPVTDVEVLKKATPTAGVVDYTPNGLGFLFFSNVMDPNSPFKDPRMRQAASLAIDRQGLIDTSYPGGAVWCNLINPGLGKWHLDPQSKEQGPSARWFKHDPRAAKQLIAAAGHADTAINFLYPNNAYGTGFNAYSETLARVLVDAGFKISVVTVDYPTVYINSGRGIFSKGAPPNTIVHALETPFSNPDEFLSGMLTKDGNRNHDLLDDPDLAAMVQKQQLELDEYRRLQLVHEIQRAHAEKMYYPPITSVRAFVLTQPWVQNFFLADDANFGTGSFAHMSVNNR